METVKVRSLDLKKWHKPDKEYLTPRQSEELLKFEQYFDSSPVGFILLGSNGVAYLNPRVSRSNPAKIEVISKAIMKPVHEDGKGNMISTLDLAEYTFNPTCRKLDFDVSDKNYQLRISRISACSDESFVQIAVTDVTKDRKIAEKDQQIKELEAENRLLKSMGEVQRDLIEKSKTENEIRESRERILATVRTIINHDTKSPLTSIKGYSQLVLAHLARTPITELQSLIANALKIIDNASSLANLRLSDAIETSSEPKIEKVNANDFLKTILAVNADLINPDKKEVKVFIEQAPSEDPIYLLTDKRWMVPVVNTLILNGRDAGATEVLLRFGEIRGKCILFVKDNGEGMYPETVEMLNNGNYEKYNSKKGSGLGFKNAKELTELLGGRLWIDQSSSEGTVLAIEFPLCLTNI